MRSKWVNDYVAERIQQAQHELARGASKQAVIDDNALIARAVMPTKKAVRVTPMNNEQLDQLADRIASRVLASLNVPKSPGDYQSIPDRKRLGWQGQYADDILRSYGIFEEERRKLYGGQ